MKYPQLVSTRAVNAISDWLVSRLEQLGVEAPLIYSRLLLSLLQSSVQINDPIEFSNLETFLANRKGTSKRYPPCDTDTLKKIAAVQCLMDIVSSEQEITKIENLVDELCEKVNDIEKQTTNLEEDDDLQLAASTLNSVLTTRSAENKAQSTSSTAVEADSTKKLSQISDLSLSRKTKEQTAIDAEDPRKRYYRAFPALSKEMEDSITLLRRNTKSLTWPVDRKVNKTNEIATTAGSVNASALASEQSNISTAAVGPSSLLNNSPRDNKTVLCNTAGVKRKTKRRRNQAMSKGKTTAGNNTRKNSYCGGSSSPTWDTDFEGSWEMGRDLIKEFIVKQNNRNRSTSESAAYNMASGGSNGVSNMATNEVQEKRMKAVVNETNKKQEPIAAEVNEQHMKNQNDEMAQMSAEQCVVEISFCDDLVENSKSDDTLASVSEITEGSLSTARRLYERDISNDSINEQSIHDNPSHHPSSSASSSEQLDFAQFKAKFNSSVEALWKNSNSSGGSISGHNQSKLQLGVGTDSGVSAAPYRSEDLKNFWTNYYSHHYDVDKFKQSNNESCDYSSTDASAMGYASKGDGHSDYFSLPTINAGVGGSEDFDKSVGGKRTTGKTSPIGVFLQNTIWSENLNANYTDTDESFFIKVLNSTTSAQKSQDQFKMDSDKSYYYPYQTSKWSEGINGVPHNGNNITVQQHPCQQQQQQPLIITSSSSSSSISTMDPPTRGCYTNEIADSTSSSSSSYLGGNPNWQIPSGNNLQADIKSWDLSNPTSLTELYGGGCVASLGKKNSTNFDRHAVPAEVTASTSTDTPTITLANHSSTGSGFIAYSRIKSYIKLIDAKPAAKWQKPEDEYHHIASSSATSDDENLLTSERTHFHPIKMTYADGHTFEISNSLDPVDFERSESGYMYLESEKYLEYTRSDILAEDDNSVAGQYYRNSTLSLDSVSSVASNKSLRSDFVIRFRVRTTDKACQTTTVPNMMSSSLVYQLASAHLSRSPMQAGQYTLNDDEDDEDDWMDFGCNSGGLISEKYEDESVSMDQWSMAEIGRRCLDNNNSSHTLWGMCPACNNDMKSVPANRLLKAELSIEGDEIMSDLKYMQDLYIGNDWEDQNATKDEGGCDDDDTDLDAETIRDCDIYQAMATPAGCGEMEEEDPEQKDILYNVNKLIADLLRPENAHNLANALGAVGVSCVGGVGCFGIVGGAGGVGGGGNGCSRKFGAENVDRVENAKDEKYVGGLWNSDENIIWKKEFNPIDIFSRLNNNNNDSFLEKLNWEYSNLAEIWGKALPEKAGLSTTEEFCSAEVDPVIEDERHQTPTTNEAFEDEENMKIACKNMKNLLKSSTITPPNGNSAVFEMNERRLNECRRMQGFLASNKFKISNRFDRKRRHSASQNVCSNNNNISLNNNNIYDNNNLKLPLLGPSFNSSPITPVTTTSTTTQTNATTKDMLTDYGRNLSRCNDDDKQRNSETIQHDDDDQQEKNNPQATIITCKYWTTMRPIIGGSIVGDEDISDDNSIDAQTADASFFIDKNSQFLDGLPSITLNTSSILKHVTLVSRPLTR